jgi:hypothetical protein
MFLISLHEIQTKAEEKDPPPHWVGGTKYPKDVIDTSA